MLFNILGGGREGLITALLCLPVILFSLSFHEAAHGYVAYKLGDPTARNLGRLTLNPMKHLDPFGALAMLLIGFGWAKPVPIVARNFKNPRWGMGISAIAGPVSNLLLGLCGCVLFSAASAAWSLDIYMAQVLGQGTPVIKWCLLNLAYIFTYMNFALMAFNLIPIPPFDGSRFAYLLLPSKWYFKVMKYEQTLMIIIIVGFLALSRAGFSPVGFVAGGLMDLICNPLTELFVKIF
ncbi:MAG: site-2 protease family protein [Clostridia bacterium]|nr:site-2 protease family protein [Clostridia bacterium]